MLPRKYADRIKEHRERQERLEEAAGEARAILAERREVLDDVETIAACGQGDAGLPGGERADRAPGLHRVFRQGDRRNPRRRPDALHRAHDRG